jgi:signal transduction histidine kinase
MGYLDLLQEGAFGLLPVEQTSILRRIDRNARELLDLVSAILDMSRLEAGRLPVATTEVQVAELLKEVDAETQGLQEQSSLTFAWRVEANLPPLQTDPGKLKTVIKNLIGNAVKFTEQGRITVEAHRWQEGVGIVVTDTGIGIPRDALALIFEPFHQVDSSVTRQYGGTGLGLYIVKRLLEVLGGTIAVESEVGCGSTFRVWLPTGEGLRGSNRAQ